MSYEDNPGLLSVLQSRLGEKVPHNLRRASDEQLCSPNGNDAMDLSLPLFAANVRLLVDECIWRKNHSGFQVRPCSS